MLKKKNNMNYKKFEDPRYFGKLFGNYRFKKSYSDHINGLMMKIYEPDGNWGRLLGVEGNYGVINTNINLSKATIEDKIRNFYIEIYNNTDPKWSLLNYVNTHWSSFMHIVNTVNYWISTKQVDNNNYLTFSNNIFDDLNDLKRIMNITGEYIFKPKYNLNVFWKIMGSIATSTYIGNLGEFLTLESLSILGDVSDVIKSQPGMRLDTHGGIDILFKLNGIPKTLQCKSFTQIIENENNYIFPNISNSSWYNVDFFSFVNKRKIYVFLTKNKNITYEFNKYNQSYLFDKSLLQYEKNI